MPIITGPDRPTHDLGDVRFTSLATPSRGSTETSVWRVTLVPGAPGVPHQVTREEVFVVVSGTARVSLGEVTGIATPGDAVVVPADTEFAIGNDGSEDLDLLCCLPVCGQAVTADGETFTPPWAT
jgi:mannose-6-phosphate isomerase-like protein (cupin superfamily)